MSVPDNGPLIVGITWWLTFFCGGFLGLRLYAKLSRKQGLWWDDHILIASWIFLLIEAIVTQMGQVLGFGKQTKNIPVENLSTIALYTSIGASISCFASTFSKISFGVTLLRLTNGKLRAFVWFWIIGLFLVMIPSALNTWIQCKPMEKAWNSTIAGTCWPASITVNYGNFNAAFCAVADFALALLPWKLLYGLQLKTREKLGLGLCMSLGVLAGICAIVKGVYIIQLRQQDFYYNGKDVTIWTAVETATAIIAASIPVLRVFFKEAVSSYSHSRGARSGLATNGSHMHSQAGGGGGVNLSRISRNSLHRGSMHGIVKGKDGGWTTLDPIEDGESQKSFRREGERDLERGSPEDFDKIMQTSTVTVTVEKGSARERVERW